MKVRRHFAVGFVVLSIACGFPSVKYSPDASSEGDGSSELDGDVSDAVVDVGPADAGPDAKPPLPDGGSPCDKDGDGYKSEACGGDDCDDVDLRANKGVTMFKYYAPVSPTFGDWDCSHSVEPLIKSFNLNCGAYLALTTTCTALAGYDGPGPACGSFANYVTCKAGVTNCVVDTMKSVQQACK